MRKALIAGSLLGAMAFAGVAMAGTDVFEVTSEAPKGGKKSKPKPVGPRFTVTARGPNGDRPASSPDSVWWWDGIEQNSKKFPACSAKEIDAAQSDSVCSQKSLMATGRVVGMVGPASDPSSNVSCTKSLNLYNGGNNEIVWYGFGPPSECAGIAYIPPWVGEWETKGDSAVARSFFPTNVVEPLPGVGVGLVELSFDFRTLTTSGNKKKQKKLNKKAKKAKKQGNQKKASQLKKKAKKAGAKVGLLESVGCKGTRTFTYEHMVDSSVETLTADAGRC